MKWKNILTASKKNFIKFNSFSETQKPRKIPAPNSYPTRVRAISRIKMPNLDKFTNKRFGGKNDLDFDGIPNKKDCQPRNTFRQDKYYRGIDDFELKLFQLKGQLEPHSKSRDIPKKNWVTPKKAIAERYGDNVLEVDLDPADVKTVPGRSKMFYTEKAIWPGQVNNITNTRSSNNGATIEKQQEWKRMKPIRKATKQILLPDSDQDDVPDEYDCEPNNPERQDTQIVEGIENGYVIYHPDGQIYAVAKNKPEGYKEFFASFGKSNGYEPNIERLEIYTGTQPIRIIVKW